jgi:hypothetical protein
MLGWTVEDLAREARISRETARKLIRPKPQQAVKYATLVRAVAAINAGLRQRGYKEVEPSSIEGLVVSDFPGNE